MFRKRIEQSLLTLWYSPGYLYLFLQPLSWVYRLIISLRKAAYAIGFYKKSKLQRPVIVVGNITVGGTGKTPLVIYICQQLQQQGLQPGIISRGYGGSLNQGPSVVTSESNPALLGDEAVMLAQRTRVPVVVARDRVAAGRALIKQFPECNVIVSDDGLQHFALGRDIEMVVIDGERAFGNQKLLPAGPLREPLSRLREVDFVITNGERWVARDQISQTMKLKSLPLRNILNPEQCVSLEAFKKTTVHALAGIGNPQRFFSQLRSLGLSIFEHPFPDHYLYQVCDLQVGEGAVIVMTEKDAIKCKKIATPQCWYLPVEAELPEAFMPSLIQRLTPLINVRH